MDINPQNFLLGEVPQFHPLSRDYINFWREEKRKCIEGTWLGGYYMPPSLYFYVNYATIELNKNKRSSVKVFSRPWLRELEWDLFQAWTVAQGFSGFEDDPTYTCHKEILEADLDVEDLRSDLPYLFKPDGSLKTYMDPLKYLKMQHPQHYKYPTYTNGALNLMFMGSRDSGKSFLTGAGIVGHQFLFDGKKRYQLDDPEKSKIDITVGAEGADKSKLLLDKLKYSLLNLPGKQETAGRVYPSPFSKMTKGSWDLGKEIKAEYQKKVQGGWETKGSGATIKHRSFRDNPFADQGSRPSIIVLEEVGLFSNLKEVYYNTKNNLTDGTRKIGSLILLGTGGDMDKGTIDAAEMFYNPEGFDILPFEDVWENRGKIAYFIEATMVQNAYLDEQKFMDRERAVKAILKEREKAKKVSSVQLNKEMQYKPLRPSEMFLAKTANVFPTAELRRRLSEILADPHYKATYSVVNLYFDPNAPHGVNYDLEVGVDPIMEFPTKDDQDREGAVVIYDFPEMVNQRVPEGLYIIGCDPFKDDTDNGGSLASIYVTKTNKYPHLGHEEIVASYVGRPYMGKNGVNEILHKLSLFYGNAKIYFENSVGNVKDYFEKIRRLDLLALQPKTVFNKKAAVLSNENFVYGYPMSNQKVKWESLQYLRSWLLQERGTEGENLVRNLDLIPDIGLLQELIAFNMDGNFDRVMSCVGIVIGLEELHNLSTRRASVENAMSDLAKEFNKVFTNNSRLFKNETPKTTPLILKEGGEGL